MYAKTLLVSSDGYRSTIWKQNTSKVC